MSRPHGKRSLKLKEGLQSGDIVRETHGWQSD